MGNGDKRGQKKTKGAQKRQKELKGANRAPVSSTGAKGSHRKPTVVNDRQMEPWGDI